MHSPGAGGLRLLRGPDRAAANDALAEAAGGRVGLQGPLDDLNRVAEPAFAPGRLTTWAFAWDREDSRSARWWPQGITTSADAGPDETFEGRRVVVTTSYSKNLGGLHKGSRITVADVTDLGRIRYRHVLLVAASIDSGGALAVRPVKVHAGGVVWSGSVLHVAATARGVLSFRLEDLVRVTSREQDELGAQPDGSVAGYGHRYLLPLHCAHEASAAEGVEPFRYSFLSLARSAAGTTLLAGEYGQERHTHRLLSTPLDETGQLRVTPEGHAEPVLLDPGGVPRMQGVAAARGRIYATSSRGRYRLGSLYVGRPGHLREVRDAVPVGPEDLAHWPSRGELWSLSEYPRQRLVFTVDLDRVDRSDRAG
jgi:hypothetical protein